MLLNRTVIRRQVNGEQTSGRKTFPARFPCFLPQFFQVFMFLLDRKMTVDLSVEGAGNTRACFRIATQNHVPPARRSCAASSPDQSS